MFYLVAMVTKSKKILNFSLLGCHGNHNFTYSCIESYFYQCHHIFCNQKLIKFTFFVKNVIIIIMLAISPKNIDLNGAKLSQDIFHFESTAIFFKIGQITKKNQLFVASLSYDAAGKNDTSLLKINEMA